MDFDSNTVRNYLSKFQLRELFINVLGWDNFLSRSLTITIDEKQFILEPIAQKRGLVALICRPSTKGLIPKYPLRIKIDKQVSKAFHEHLIVYVDGAETTQIWQWIRRQIARPPASREHAYYKNSSGAALIQKLKLIQFGIEEEDGLTILDVARRAKLAFDIERVTKRFYEIYRKEHFEFLKIIDGITSPLERQLYTSIVLDRLMFIYFIQKKGFLDKDTNYLRNKLAMIQELKGKNKFITFYKHFLMRLFHEGLGAKSRTSELDSLLGTVPYLNGGLFEVRELERLNEKIEIPDSAFERVFNFFDAFQWHLDDRPLKADNEINPDVLGYIFEKYVNQREMGAYYTKDDITEYMTKNIIIPFLYQGIQDNSDSCKDLIELINEYAIHDPDRYILPAMKEGIVNAEGVERRLPEEISAGINDISKRGEWNTAVSAEFGPTTETWREHVARRRLYSQARSILKDGKISSIGDFVTLNLDMGQLAQDTLQGAESATFLKAAYEVLRTARILDPTCGSGAFLFQALNVLEPLYESCLNQMEMFVHNPEESQNDGEKESIEFFKVVLKEMGEHPNYRYFIMKSIMLNNLFGVDIMEEATEICKLRLFLKLAAQIEPDFSKPNLGLEPLPDIDFNIPMRQRLSWLY